MENDARHVAILIAFKVEMGIDEFGKETALRFRKDRTLSLPSRLRHQLIILESDRELETGSEFIDADVALQCFDWQGNLVTLQYSIARARCLHVASTLMQNEVRY